MLKIYHNTRCSKSRCALEMLKETGQEMEVVEYLKTPPTANELKDLLQKLNMKPEALVRKGEALFKEKFAGQEFSDAEWIRIMVENPILIERPIVVNGDKAVVARPPEKVQEIL